MDFKDKYVYPEYDYDNTLWRWINKTLEETSEENAEKLLKLVRVMWSKDDERKWDEAQEDIRKKETEIKAEYEELADQKLTFYYEDDDYSRAVRFNAKKKEMEEIEAMKADLILDFVMSTDCIAQSFERRQKHAYMDKV